MQTLTLTFLPRPRDRQLLLRGTRGRALTASEIEQWNELRAASERRSRIPGSTRSAALHTVTPNPIAA